MGAAAADAPVSAIANTTPSPHARTRIELANSVPAGRAAQATDAGVKRGRRASCTSEPAWSQNAKGTRNPGSQMYGKVARNAVDGSVTNARNGVGSASWAWMTTVARMRIPTTFTAAATHTRDARRSTTIQPPGTAGSPARMTMLRPAKVISY